MILCFHSNFGYLNHFYNFYCFLTRLDLKFLLIALDHETYSAVKFLSPNISVVLFEGSDPIMAESQSFRTSQFNLISRYKKVVVFEILMLGYDVLFVVVDVILINDPVKLMIYNNVDYVHSGVVLLVIYC